MPQVRKFVKEEGHADSYEGLEVVYIKGRSPNLVIYDDNDVQVGRHDISRMKLPEIHSLVARLGFKRKHGMEPYKEEL